MRRPRTLSALVAAVLLLSWTGGTAAADDAGSPSTTTGDGGQTGTAVAGDPGAGPTARRGPGDVDPFETITFSEHPLGTAITTQYQERGIVLGGDAPFITTDGSNPSSPVLSGSPLFQGTVVGTFVTADGSPRTVSSLELDVGYIDTAGSVHVVVLGLDGTELLEVPLGANGIVHVTITQTGIASFRVETTSDEPAGFAVDNLRFLSATASDVVVADTYVAVGDSYQSGQGAGAYEAGTDNDGNGCRRSANAYPNLLVADGAVNLTLDFRACSGAVIHDFYAGQHDDQGPQLDALGSDTRLVTVGIVGNDLEFADTMTRCVLSVLGNAGAGGTLLSWWRSCMRIQDAAVDARIDELRTGSLRVTLGHLYRDIRDRAPNARVVVLDYPQFFTEQGLNGYPGCTGVRSSDQVWLNEKVRQADDVIGEIAAEAGFEHVSMLDVLAEHHACTAAPAINAAIVGDPLASFHPNALGHRLIADRLEAYLAAPVEPTFTIRSQQTVTSHYEIRGSVLSLNVGWPGSDVVTSLVSPSGVRYTREDVQDADHGVGPTWEYWTITGPEPGRWTVESFGADVAPDGEPVTYAVVDRLPANQPPTAVVATTHDGATYTFDATGSVDPDGTVAQYEWELADGSTATGPVVTHTFAPGVYDVTLVVTDDQGARGFGSADRLVQVEPPSDGTSLFATSGLLVPQDVSFGTAGLDVRVVGDLDCGSTGRVTGTTVLVTGDARLSGTCTVEGSLTVGGAVTVSGSARVTGDLVAVGPVRLSPDGAVTGAVVSGAEVTVSDGSPVDALVSDGSIGGPVVPAAPVPAPEVGATPSVDPFSAGTAITWADWLRSIAPDPGARPWTAGTTGRPTCSLSPSSTGTGTVPVTRDTVVDARGCTAVSISMTTFALSADLTLVVDGVLALAPSVVSADGRAHTLRLVQPRSTGADAPGGVHISRAVADDLSTVELDVAGDIVVFGETTMRMRGTVGHLLAIGPATL